ncbi:hypothetical protein HT031_005119 [Scenedesmus sp. PABB004]|nr:hypothetical protein HT031_005119 [Scenedesmus sp. PABB004]
MLQLAMPGGVDTQRRDKHVVFACLALGLAPPAPRALPPAEGLQPAAAQPPDVAAPDPAARSWASPHCMSCATPSRCATGTACVPCLPTACCAALPTPGPPRRGARAWVKTKTKKVGGLLQDYDVDVAATAGMSRDELAAHLCDLAGDRIDGAWEAASGRGSVARRYREAFGCGVFSARSFTRRASVLCARDYLGWLCRPGGPRRGQPAELLMHLRVECLPLRAAHSRACRGESAAQQAERERCPCCAARAPESAAHSSRTSFECGAPGRPARLAAQLADLGACGGGVLAGVLAAHLRAAGIELAVSGNQELELGAGGGGGGSVSDPGVVAGVAAPRAADASAAVSVSSTNGREPMV